MVGDEVVLIAVSFHACLDPIADYVGTRYVICTHQEVDVNGHFTGKIRMPIIGGGKKDEIRKFLNNTSWIDCCYG